MTTIGPIIAAGSGRAVVASSKPGPFQEFYTALLAKSIRPEMARLTLARKIATIVLMVWKTGACLCAGINRHEGVSKEGWRIQ